MHDKKKHNHVQHFINNTLDNLELFKGSFTSHKFKPHFHESYTIIFMDYGVGDYSNDSSNFILSTGSILIFNPYEVHTGKPVNNSPWNFLTMYIPIEIMKKAMDTLNLPIELPVFKENIINNKNLFKKGKAVFPDLIYKQHHPKSESLLLDFLKELIVRYAYTEIHNEPISEKFTAAKQIKEYIHTHYLEEVSTNDLSNLTGISEYGLIKSFKQHYQLPPHQYLVNLRIEKAKKLLAERLSATEVAYQSGFFDQSHFTRHFKKIIGMTPKQFANKIII
ncbi:AraC family transcriptional regulator [Aquimarina muelleri]|uniref:AraC family transcriptional regulator n=1 Tax=Aquimarina muelleri TaxID=279356 RepID=A0A918N3S3_9FLAO|nr:AraC family transcriptional regulator [Aquimarina muelleri]MCX2761466.1 AraC family transcriptional regulator [Aquimarina muelleri]GGX13923.1 AraC family transcriptional regulator [Aquimarina muelleri]